MRKIRPLLLLLVAVLLADGVFAQVCPAFSKRNNGTGGACSPNDIGNIPAGKLHSGRFTFTASSPATDYLLTKVELNGNLLQLGTTVFIGTKWFGNYNGASKDLCFYGNSNTDNATPAGHWRLYFFNPSNGVNFFCDYFIDDSGNPSSFNAGTIGADTTICAGTSTNTLRSLTPATGNTGALGYQWQQSTSSASTGWADIPGATGLTYTPGSLSQTTYFQRIATDVVSGVTVMSSNSNVITVTVIPNADPGTLSGTQSVCTTKTTTFSSTVTGGTWSSSATAIATVNSTTGVVTGVAPGTATITYTVAGVGSCPPATATRTVTVVAPPAAPVVSITQPTCSTATGSIQVTSPTGAGFTYSVNGGAFQSSATFSGLSSGSYSVVARNSTGCVGAATNFTIAPQPATPATPGPISGLGTVAPNVSQTYSVTAVPGATSYSWTLPAGWIGASTTNTITVTTGSNGGTVSVVANANGCTSGASTLSVSIAAVTDSDGDGIPDSIEGNGDADGDGIPNYLDLDSDGDGIPDSLEDSGCNGVAPCSPTDTDGDGIPNYLDLDSDNDGIPDSIEDNGCNGVAPCTPTDTDNDGIPNYLDLDSDNDGIPDSIEDAGCNGVAPCTPTDSDNDGIPNYLDLDSDNDGIPDSIEDAGCNGVAPCTPTDTDNDGTPNYLDLDSDNDGIPDSIEDAGCNGVAPCTPTDSDNDGVPNYLDLDSDNDGILDADEDAACTGSGTCLPTDTDGDGVPNYLDLDSDNDGCSDANEAYNSLTAQGSDGNQYFGNGNPPTVNANGQVVGATYPAPGSNYTTAGASPVISAGPANQLGQVGTNASFQVTATVSVGAINYQWQVSTNGGTTWSNLTNGAPYSGVTTNIMTITNITSALQGNRYRAIAFQNGYICRADTSGSATLSVNLPPVAVNDVVSSPEDQVLNGNVLSNDTDPNANPLTVTQFTVAGLPGTFTAGQTATIPGVGTLVINPNGTFTFTPVPNYNGTVPVATYTISDGQGGTATATLSITVTAVNDAPVAVNDVATTPEDTPVSGNVLTNDSDVDGNPLTITQFVIGGQTYPAGTTATIPGVGTLVINPNGTFTFTPAPNYNGTVPVATYTVSDGQGGTATATLSITVTAVNDAPVAVNDVATTPEDTPVSGNVLTNDSDVDGNPLVVTQFSIAGLPGTFTAGQTATIPGVGTLVINPNGTFTFTPALNYNGTVPVATYTVSDGQGGTATATLSITVTAVNDAPVAVNDVVSTPEDQPVSGNVLTNDTDVDGNPLTVTQFTVAGLPGTFTAGQTATIPGVGTLVINPNGTFTFTPAPNYNGAVPVATYTISDGQGGTASATLTITVTAVNDAPVAVNDVVSTPEDQPVSGNVLTNDTDIDGNPLTVTQFVIGGQTYPAGATATLPGVGTLVINPNGTFTFTPAPNYNGTVPVATYTISDGQGGTATATLTITVQSVADPDDITITTTAVCSTGPVTLTASTTTVASPVFRWYSDAALGNLLFTGATYVTPAITSTTTYFVSVSGTGVQPNQPGNGKTAVATILPAPARPTIGANGPLTFCKDDSVILDAGVATAYQWFKNGTAIGGATQRTYTAKEQGDYTVVVTSAAGCPSQPSSPALVRVPCVKGIYMPTVFTPNQDGKNDTVKPSVPGMKKFQCYKIYNRWGNLVFDNQGVLQAWDGTYKGVNQPADTYLWVVQGEDGQGKPMRATGQITLIR